MKNKFKRLFSCLSAIVVTTSALPIVELSAIAEDTETEKIPIEEENSEELYENSDEATENDSFNEEEVEIDFESLTLDYPDILANSDGITREEWIHELVTVFDMTVEDDTSIEYFITDIASSPYADDIDLAANFGVFELDDTTFDPEGYVTREFAAHTANFCMGYLNDGTEVTFKDSDSIYYEDDAIVAVQKGWFTLSNGNFKPDSYITTAESKAILADAKISVEDTIIDTDAESSVTYNSSVVQIEDTATAVYAGDTVTITGSGKTIRPSGIFVVKINGTDSTFTAKKVTKNTDGSMVVTVEETAFSDAVEAIDIQGVGDVDYSNVTLYNSATMPLPMSKPKVNDENVLYMDSISILANSSNSIPISKSIDLDGVTVKLSGNISNIKPEYKLQRSANGEIQSFYLNTSADADLTASVSGEFKGTKSKEVKLASVPVFCGGVFNVTVDLTATVSLSGEISLTYNYDISGGVSYTKAGGWRTTRNFQKKSFSLEAESAESIAIKARVAASVGTEKIGEAYVMAGEKGSFSGKVQPDGMECCTLNAYLFAEFGANIDLFGIVKFNKSYQFINAQNSPIKYYQHWENDKPVDKCTYGETTDTTKNVKAKSYVDYTNYGIEYEGVITLANSADSGSEMPYYTWDNAKTLDGDVTVNGDLYVNNKLDLNGYNLKVKGSIIIGETGYIRMNNSSSTLNVNGDFTTESLKDCMYQGGGYGNYNYNYFGGGVIIIGGNLYQNYASVDNFSLDGTELRFIGNGTHTISALNSGTDINNLKLSQGVIVALTGNMNGFTNIEKCTFTYSDSEVLSTKDNTIIPTGTGRATAKITNADGKTYSISVVVAEMIRGDCNLDGEVSIADAVMLQRWLLGTGSLTSWQNADLCEDKRINVFDMIMMRKLLIENK